MPIDLVSNPELSRKPATLRPIRSSEPIRTPIPSSRAMPQRRLVTRSAGAMMLRCTKPPLHHMFRVPRPSVRFIGGTSEWNGGNEACSGLGQGLRDRVAAFGPLALQLGDGGCPRPRTAAPGRQRARVNVLDRLDTILRCRGGARLEGSIDTHGAKNAALPIMAATILTNDKVTLQRVPRITDVSVMWSLLEALGARLTLDGPNTVTIDASNVNTHRAPYALVRKLAASFDLCGPLLGRFSRAEVPLPGGCILGTRATDMHEAAFIALGCDVHNKGGYLIAESKHRRLQGGPIEFRMPSVGATKNAMLAAVVSDGITTIKNAAMEPEVVDLANFLVAMGAKISGHGSDTIQIDGV